MTILIDADGCPVVDLTLRSAGKKRCAGCDSVRYIPSYRAGRGTDAGI